MIHSPLFEKLTNDPPKWWSALVSDKDIAIQIRKNNYIDAYFNGGNIIRKLSYGGKSFRGETHFKYIPIETEYGDYVPFVFENNTICFGKIEALKVGCFEKQSLSKIKSNIIKYYPNDSEKAIQYEFINNDPYFIDSEFEYSYKKGDKIKTIRIDLVRIDASIKKIVFVEVKTIGDRRLFNNEIVRQLRDYKEFITNYRVDLIAYYKKILAIKRNLKILPGCLEMIV